MSCPGVTIVLSSLSSSIPNINWKSHSISGLSCAPGNSVCQRHDRFLVGFSVSTSPPPPFLSFIHFCCHPLPKQSSKCLPIFAFMVINSHTHVDQESSLGLVAMMSGSGLLSSGNSFFPPCSIAWKSSQGAMGYRVVVPTPWWWYKLNYLKRSFFLKKKSLGPFSGNSDFCRSEMNFDDGPDLGNTAFL